MSDPRFRTVHEVSMLVVPTAWRPFPDHILAGLAWWENFSLINLRRLGKDFYPVSAPRDVETVLATSADDVRAIKLRHPCADCAGATLKAIETLEAGATMVVIIQVTFDIVDLAAAGR